MAMKKIKIELTPAQYSILSTILRNVDECMEWDDDLQQYADGARFLLSLDKTEYAVFKRLIEKV